MITKKTITYLSDKNMVLLIPAGLSLDELEPIKILSPTIKVYHDDEFVKERRGISYMYYESLIPNFDNPELLMFVKNPYWRILEVYLWKYLYYESYGSSITKTFKKTIKKLYGTLDVGSEKENRLYVNPQNLNLTNNYFICENFQSEFKKWFSFEIEVQPRQNIRVNKPTSLYDLSMQSLSDFYDSESAEIVYNKHRKVFEKFNYDFYSYLDYHDPIRKIHVLHGDLVNKFEI